MTDLRLDAGMGPAVLDHLRQFADLPGDGLVAGQAVASAVSEIFGEGWGVAYNDIDVFRHYHRLGEDESRRELREKKRVIDTVHFTALELEIGWWSPYSAMREVAVKRQGKYSVVKTERDDMLNMVYYDHGYANADTSFLSTFDINAGQVGVDITTGKLLWTSEFERYLRTRQLEIVTLHTPYQSLIRYFKKREELDGTYGNDARMTEMVGLAYAMATSPSEGYNPKEDESLRWRFGGAIADKLDGVMSDIRPNFDIASEQVKGMELYQLVPRFEVDRDMLKLVRRQQDIAHVLPRLSRTLREARRKAFMARARYVTEPTIMLDRERENPRNISQLVWLMQGDVALEGNSTVSQLEALDDFVYTHDLSGFFLNRTLARSLEIKEQIERAIETRGRWLYGALRLLTDENPDDAFNIEGWFDGFMEREAERQRRHVLEPVLPKQFSIIGTEVVELCTRRALLDEGVALHHCVGSYSRFLPEGNSRFFSLRPTASKKTWLTLHLVMDLDEENTRPCGWRVEQVKGLCNRVPLEHEQHFVGVFVAHFNVFYLNSFAGGMYRVLGDAARWGIAHGKVTGVPALANAHRVVQAALGLPSYWYGRDGQLVMENGLTYWRRLLGWKLELARTRVAKAVGQLRAYLTIPDEVDDETSEALR